MGYSSVSFDPTLVAINSDAASSAMAEANVASAAAVTAQSKASDASSAAAALGITLGTTTITYVIDGGGSAITTGVKGFLEIPFACTITGWTLVADVSGSIVIDVQRSTYAGFPPTVSIAGSEKPTLASVQKNQDLTLTTWTTAITAGDVLGFNVDSATTVTRCTLSLKATRP